MDKVAGMWWKFHYTKYALRNIVRVQLFSSCRKSNDINPSMLAIHDKLQLFEKIKLCALAFVRGAENAIVGGGFYLEKMGGARVMTP